MEKDHEKDLSNLNEIHLFDYSKRRLLIKIEDIKRFISKIKYKIFIY